MRDCVQRLAIIASAVCLGCKSLPASVSATTRPEISQGDLRVRLAIFADDSMLGRSALTGGHDRAVRYIAAEAARMGLNPAGENNTYFQTFDIRERRLDSASRLIVGDVVLRPVVDFKVFPFGRGNLRDLAGAQVVFGGIVGDTSTQISSQLAANRLVLLGVPTNMTADRVYANVIY